MVKLNLFKVRKGTLFAKKSLGGNEHRIGETSLEAHSFIKKRMFLFELVFSQLDFFDE